MHWATARTASWRTCSSSPADTVSSSVCHACRAGSRRASSGSSALSKSSSKQRRRSSTRWRASARPAPAPSSAASNVSATSRPPARSPRGEGSAAGGWPEIEYKGSAIALVLAGGEGRRMGRPKQFIELRGMPALHYTLRAFEESPEVARIYTVGDRERIEALVQAAGISKYAACAEPGEARSFSTRNGLLLCEEDPETIVLVHDGSRCLVTPDLIERVVRAADRASEPDGVIPGVPVSDTIKIAREGIVAETLDRTNLWAIQTPQAFRLGLLRRIHDSSEELIRAATDDASLVERDGGRVEVVAGEKTNIKLTSPEDLVFAEAILAEREGASREVSP